MIHDDDLESARELLTRLIEIPSVNPADDPESEGERAVAEEVAAYCSAIGMEVTLEEVFPGRPNVEAVLRAQNAKGALLFEVHTDTVALPLGEAVPTARSEGNRVYGRGACDVKGGLTAILLALTDLSESSQDLAADVILLGAADEESQFRGVVKYLESPRKVNGAVVIEPTGLRSVIGHSGCVRFTVTVNGTSAHSSRPELGRSAIKDAYTAIHALEDWSTQRGKERLVPPRKPPQLTVNRITGGRAFNIVPDLCTFDVDIRTVSSDDPQAVADELAELLEGLSTRGVRAHISEVVILGWGLEPEPLALINSAAKSALSTNGVDPEEEYVTFGTDASKLTRLGNISSIVLGPGDANQAHTDDEFVELADILKARDIYRDIALEFGRRL